MNLNRSKKNQSVLSIRRNLLRFRPTAEELRIKDILESLGVGFIFQKGFYHETTHYIIDFYIPKFGKLCLEIDGSHHLWGPQLEYDSKRTLFLERIRGFRVKRLTNQEAAEITDDALLKFITPDLK